MWSEPPTLRSVGSFRVCLRDRCSLEAWPWTGQPWSLLASPSLQGSTNCTEAVPLRGGSSVLGCCGLPRPQVSDRETALLSALPRSWAAAPGTRSPQGRPGPPPSSRYRPQRSVRRGESEETRVKWALLPENFPLRNVFAFCVHLRICSTCKKGIPGIHTPKCLACGVRVRPKRCPEVFAVSLSHGCVEQTGRVCTSLLEGEPPSRRGSERAERPGSPDRTQWRAGSYLCGLCDTRLLGVRPPLQLCCLCLCTPPLFPPSLGGACTDSVRSIPTELLAL